MCGIVGLFGDTQENLIDAMLERLAHRGPDGEGVHRLPAGATPMPSRIGHRRLAIIDPDEGHQPLVDRASEGRRAIAANGMLYNYKQLREHYGASNFDTKCDAESIFKACQHEGAGGVDMLDGMFAYVYVDGDQLIAARDPLGIKPLYYAKDGDRLQFASEIKALLDAPGKVEEFPAGHVMTTTIGSGDLNFRQYYHVPPPHEQIEDAVEAAKLVRETLEAAIEKRMQTDVPLGCFLSGGLDSSVITAMAVRHQPDMHTFAVGVEGSGDLKAARLVADYLGTQHHELLITPEAVREALPEILYYLESYDRDLVRSSVPCWFVSKLATEHVKVVLTGEGADELFAGYTFHKDYRDDGQLDAELRRGLLSMHNINLQRVDRMTMAHGLEARVAFLDPAMIEASMRIAPALKLPTIEGVSVEKWILRKAVEDLLPREIVWRDKLQFDEGSGLSDLLQEIVPDRTNRFELPDGRHPRSDEEAWYARTLGDRYADDPTIFALTARWEDNRVA
ncbi:asparagine synthase (glutamine-hydrolyzing) [Stratiformator vulcanicus]|uniref:asparagine synthase (glutamine-hydrolyzing) n=1 Tax=Stratiformator vulcanicus TaxID=2527980 RepID=A0A517QWV5_9PLAN|nr:asparagine synthase (glutamine-hydrolyzing) [Stratiformator vulcanicus]QDT36084.1 Asparagine synthetase B [glutamine-hydrolyzing] [Stratiformator vulcanicus]